MKGACMFAIKFEHPFDGQKLTATVIGDQMMVLVVGAVYDAFIDVNKTKPPWQDELIQTVKDAAARKVQQLQDIEAVDKLVGEIGGVK